MDFILSVLSVIFVGLIVFAALTIGLSLLVWFFALGLIISVYLAVRRRWVRWQFVRQSDASFKDAPDVIEGSFEDITEQKK